jgi:SagB-type dehydrogenase family enzyme
LARELCLLEAGAMGQLLMSVAPHEGLGLCPIGSLDERPLAGLFALDEGHLLVHSFLGGPRAEGLLGPVAGVPAALPRLPETRWPSPLASRKTPEPPSTGLLTDELLQLEFKLSEPGLRRGDDAASILLERPPLDETLIASFASRRSYRELAPSPVPLADLGVLLGSLRQIRLPGHALPKYRYPSAGSLYPVQTYAWIKPGRVEGLPGGTYYYHPRDHRLVLLRRDVEIDPCVHVETNRGPADQAAFTLFLVADRRAIEPLYGALARDLCLLEGGYMGQLLMTEAPAAGLGLCPVGRLDFAAVRGLFALCEEHALVYTLLGGGVPAVAWAGAAAGRAAALAARPEAFREFLLGKLPSYMVPSAFVLLEDLPLTANGKVDRRALPAPEIEAAPVREAAYVAPENEVEQTLAGILQEILGRGEIGVHDNFFDLGANSVHIVQAHGRLRSAFGREVPLVEMFNHPTISALARYLDQGGEESGDFGMSEERVERLKGGQDLLKRRRENRRRLVEIP